MFKLLSKIFSNQNLSVVLFCFAYCFSIKAISLDVILTNQDLLDSN